MKGFCGPLLNVFNNNPFLSMVEHVQQKASPLPSQKGV